MSWLTLALANWRWIGAGFLSVALFAGGIWIKGKIERAAEADRLLTQLTHEREAHANSEAARIKMAGDLAAAQGNIHTVIKEVIRRVPTLVRDDRVCDFSGELTGVLNRARGYDMPSPGRDATDPAPKPKPDP